MKNILNNKILRGIGKTIYILLYIIIVLVLLVVAIQRFSNNNLTIAGFRIFNVATGSMVPVYNVGDILVSREISPEEIQVGDDIVYKGEAQDLNGRIVTHRVISVREEEGQYKIITKGIANIEEDPEITEDQVYGKVIYKVKTLSFISRLISNLYIFYFCIFVPIAILIFKQIKQIATENEEDDNDSDEK